MPYTLPAVTQFKDRFPSLESVGDSVISVLIDEAARNVSTEWCEADYQNGIMFLAAHYAIDEGSTGRSVEASGAVTSSKLGDASESYAGPQNADSNGIYSSTVYGRRFMQLRRANTQGVRLL
jgi:hypothetical protein